MITDQPSITLCYHDIIGRAKSDCSGFPGADAATYKLHEDDFREHVGAISRVLDGSARLTNRRSSYTVHLTFDDGGASSCHIADILDRYDLVGWFFIPTDYIGQSTFVTASEIVNLRRRGHHIGSHSCSHRGRMSAMPPGTLTREWTQSVAILSDIIGESVTAASVPSGYYSRRVAQTAAAAGVTRLFTLEPTTKSAEVGSCVVLGRYMIRRFTPAVEVAAICSGALLPRLRQQILWNIKKVLKVAPFYSQVRKGYLGYSTSQS